MFDQQLRAPFFRRHPVVTVAGFFLLWWSLLHGWYVPAVLTAAG